MGLSAAAANDPRAAELLSQRVRLEASIDSLRLQKTSMEEAKYQEALEDLLLKLAEVNKSLRALGGKKP